MREALEQLARPSVHRSRPLTEAGVFDAVEAKAGAELSAVNERRSRGNSTRSMSHESASVASDFASSTRMCERYSRRENSVASCRSADPAVRGAG